MLKNIAEKVLTGVVTAIILAALSYFYVTTNDYINKIDKIDNLSSGLAEVQETLSSMNLEGSDTDDIDSSILTRIELLESNYESLLGDDANSPDSGPNLPRTIRARIGTNCEFQEFNPQISCVRTATGKYNISFNPPFRSLPFILLTGGDFQGDRGENTDDVNASFNSLTNSSLEVATRDISDERPKDGAFFILATESR